MPGQVRDAERTRRVLLDAAARSAVTHGAGVSLDVVAREAGVSKGGLLHHFPSKDELMAALADDLFDRFDQAVQDRIDPDDTAPGRLLRAYVRATFDDLERGQDAVEPTTLMATLSAFPEAARRSQERTGAGTRPSPRTASTPSGSCSSCAPVTAQRSPPVRGAARPRRAGHHASTPAQLATDTGPVVGPA